MYKKTLLILFILLFAIVIINAFGQWFLPNTKYILTLAILVIGILLYPINSKIYLKANFTFSPILLVVILNLANLLLLTKEDMTSGLQVVNVFMGIYGVQHHFVLRYIDKKLSKSSENHRE